MDTKNKQEVQNRKLKIFITRGQLRSPPAYQKLVTGEISFSLRQTQPSLVTSWIKA